MTQLFATQPLAPLSRDDGSANDGLSPAAARRVRAAAWPLAVLLVVHRVFIVALNGTLTDDFTTVYSAVRRMLDGQPVYEQAYGHVDPLYLYTPGATALLAPVGMLPFDPARTGFILLNAAAIIGGLALLTLIVGHRLSGWVWPASIAVAFATESVTNTLAFTNINGVLFLALCGFLWCFLRSYSGDGAPTAQRRWSWLAGLILGLAILIKPQFAPLLLLPLVTLDWRALAGGIGVPVALNAAAVVALDSVRGYTASLVPYLRTTRDYANSSWPGLNAYFQLGPLMYWSVWLAAAALVACTVIALLRWHRTDPALWALTTSGVLFAGIFFLSSLGQQYYSMWLFPIMFTVFLPASAFHSWSAWLAAALYLAPLEWTSTHWPDSGRWLSTFAGTLGWLLLIVAAGATVAGWLLRERVHLRA
ncbi:glycosyltransferase family 87 protein [uncultured Corynebacterium sp.]|uniref:glycosyltransferase family 87 protein n=1 Tax=uncultured Corynebacterium sp. TaxID=159447 RepID=UPI0025DEC733|nr:glycosyltransferase family 87 protein [uncultured Corynebacterium sp.]